MGCCFSKQEIEKKANDKEKALKKPRWDPPPPPPEEEKVKEVLSETPKAKPKPRPNPPPAPSSPVLKPVQKETAKDELEKKPKLKPKPSEIPPSDDRSEQPQPSDDACSLSEVSNATSVTTTRERDREEISTTSAATSLPRIPRGNANGYNRKSYSGELVGGSRRERSSPAVVTGVGCRSGRTSPGPPLRNRSFSGNGNGVKRDVGERSGRRSLSPGAKRREVVGSGVHGEKLGVNRGVPVRRVPPLPPNKAAAAAAAQLSEGDGLGTEGKESLENPSVSLECFIFL
jgi:hypothetical protein